LDEVYNLRGVTTSIGQDSNPSGWMRSTI